MDGGAQPEGRLSRWSYFTIGSNFIIALLALILHSYRNAMNRLLVLHAVPEGHVGVYWKGGALLKTTTSPGFHMMLPIVTYYEPIQVTMKTDVVRDVACPTKGGLVIHFERIEVINRLQKELVYETILSCGVDYDEMWICDNVRREISQVCRVHSLAEVYMDLFHEIGIRLKDAMQSDCKECAPGLEIIRVHVTMPAIPESIRRNMEELSTKNMLEKESLEERKKVQKAREDEMVFGC